MRFNFSDAYKVLALCVHVIGTWALSTLFPTLSASSLLVLRRAQWPPLLQEVCQPGARGKSVVRPWARGVSGQTLKAFLVVSDPKNHFRFL